jgi:hypothetical protein
MEKHITFPNADAICGILRPAVQSKTTETSDRRGPTQKAIVTVEQSCPSKTIKRAATGVGHNILILV